MLTAAATAAFALSACGITASTAEARQHRLRHHLGHHSQQCGGASWYAFTTRTASGERANPNAMTAAHRSLPFGTRVRVENERNGRSIVVRINDRGPFVGGRVIDVTRNAATKLGFKGRGTTKVCLHVMR